MMNQANLNKLSHLQDYVGLIDQTKSINEIYKEHKILTLRETIKLENCKVWHKFYLSLLYANLAILMQKDPRESIGPL